MINIIAYTRLLYLVQLLLPSFLKVGTGQKQRSLKALKNLSESLPIFLAIAILSIITEAENNTILALYWFIARIIFVLIYVTGLEIKDKSNESLGSDKQITRSIVWIISAAILIKMILNLL